MNQLVELLFVVIDAGLCDDIRAMDVGQGDVLAVGSLIFAGDAFN